MHRRKLLTAAGVGVGAFAIGGVVHSEQETRKLKRLPSNVHNQPIELLVHNISHSDLLVELGEEGPERRSRTYLARPIFNKFQPTSEAILAHMKQLHATGQSPTVINAPSKYQIRYPIGFDLSTPNAPGSDLDGAALLDAPAEGSDQERAHAAWDLFHLKGIGSKLWDRSSLGTEIGNTFPRVMNVYLPLIATVIPEWHRVLKRRAARDPDKPPPKKVLILVSGAGQPRNPQADPNDNSTEGTGKIMRFFIEAVYPDIEVQHISSTSLGIFRYDDNVRFVKEAVLPVIDRQRALALHTFGESWPDNLHVTLCLADGPPARISALNTSLRSYRPDYLHVWRLKTFWDERVVSEEDVEFHTFHTLEMRPPMHRSQLTGDMRMLVEEMIKYRRQFEAVRDLAKTQHGSLASDILAGGGEAHELGTFWLRKTRKVVMAVLLTKKSDDPNSAVFWRGMNVEVSMPTGTLCAERNAIGNALAGDQTICRKHIHGVAVLSMTLDSSGHVVDTAAGGEEAGEVALNPLDPCGACMEWLKKIGEVNPDFRIVTFANSSCDQVYIRPIGDYS